MDIDETRWMLNHFEQYKTNKYQLAVIACWVMIAAFGAYVGYTQ